MPNGTIMPCAPLIIDHDFDIFRIMKSKEAIGSLAALAQESRLAIFRMLVKRGPEGYTPTQLGEKLKVTSPTLSFHLKELQRAGLLNVRRDGRFLLLPSEFRAHEPADRFSYRELLRSGRQGLRARVHPSDS